MERAPPGRTLEAAAFPRRSWHELARLTSLPDGRRSSASAYEPTTPARHPCSNGPSDGIADARSLDKPGVSTRAELTPAPGDRRANRPGACRRPQPRAKAGANRARGQASLDRPKRPSEPLPHRDAPSADARPVRGRRAVDARRHAIGLLDIGARGRRHGRPQPAAGARRPRDDLSSLPSTWVIARIAARAT